MGLVAGSRFGRYVIVAPLGQGGMGEVHHARDTMLERDVALKVLRLAAGEETDAVAAAEGATRLLREARAAAALGHANVVAVYDVGEIDGTMFLAMELIQGRTLRELASGDAPMTQRLVWLRDVARALSAAHRRGLVHRDIKPENVMVRDDGVVKVLDFGIARRKRVDPADAAALAARRSADMRVSAQQTEAGLVGTPLYMSPEQLRGEVADERSDQFSWGVVAYEILTGKTPWPLRGSLVALLSDVLTRTPEPIDALAPEVPEQARDAITRALSRDPGQRFASMDEVVEIFEAVTGHDSGRGLSAGDERHPITVRPPPSAPPPAGPAAAPVDLSLMETLAAQVGPSTPPSSAAPPSSARQQAAPPMARPALGPRRRAWARTVAIVAALAVVLGLVAFRVAPWRGKDTGAASRSGAQVRRSIAVLGFKNLSGQARSAWLSTAVAEMLVTEMGIGGELRTIPSENVARARIDLGLPDVDTLAPDTLARLERHTGARLVVLGSYLALGDGPDGRVRLDARVQDAATGEVLVTTSESGAERDLFDLVTRTGAQIRRALHLRVIAAGDAAGVRASQASAPGASRLYAEGLDRLRAHDALAARDLFERVVASDPRFALGHAALAAAHAALGYDERAKVEAQIAFELAGGLPPKERMLVEARYRAANREWARAMEIYRSLAEASPDDPEAGLLLAATQTSAERGKDALATLAALRRLPAPLGDDPRIDLAEAEAYNVLGDMRASTRAAAAAAAGARARKARHLVARARALEGSTLASTGAAEQAREAIEEARRTFAESGDARGVADATASLGLLEAWRRNYAEAIPHLSQALERYRSIGNRAELCTTSSNIATMRFDVGALDDAWRMLDETQGASCPRGDLGALRMVRGLVLRARGDAGGAAAAYHDARADFESLGDARLMAWADAMLGELHAKQGERVRARELIERSLATREAGGLRQFAAESRLLLAELSLDEGKPAEAEALGRAAAEALAREGIACDHALAEITIAAAERAQGRDEAAHASIERARPLAASCQSPTTRLRFALAAAGDPRSGLGVDAATRALSSARDEAKARGYFEIVLRAERAIGEIEMRAGRAAEAQKRLAAASKEAAAKGFAGLARVLEKTGP